MALQKMTTFTCLPFPAPTLRPPNVCSVLFDHSDVMSLPLVVPTDMCLGAIWWRVPVRAAENTYYTRRDRKDRPSMAVYYSVIPCFNTPVVPSLILYSPSGPHSQLNWDGGDGFFYNRLDVVGSTDLGYMASI